MPRNPISRPGLRYREDIAQTVCARLEAGESLAAIGRDRAMPAPSTLAKWRRREPAFAARYEAARAAAGAQRGGRPTDFCPELAAAICARLTEGQAMHMICRQPGMPGQTAVYRWLHRYPQFLEAYLQAREIQAHRKFDQVWEIAAAATPETVGVAQLQINAIKWQVGKLAPRTYGQSVAAAQAGGLTVVIRRFGGGAEEEGEDESLATL